MCVGSSWGQGCFRCDRRIASYTFQYDNIETYSLSVFIIVGFSCVPFRRCRRKAALKHNKSSSSDAQLSQDDAETPIATQRNQVSSFLASVVARSGHVSKSELHAARSNSVYAAVALELRESALEAHNSVPKSISIGQRQPKIVHQKTVSTDSLLCMPSKISEPSERNRLNERDQSVQASSSPAECALAKGGMETASVANALTVQALAEHVANKSVMDSKSRTRGLAQAQLRLQDITARRLQEEDRQRTGMPCLRSQIYLTLLTAICSVRDAIEYIYLNPYSRRRLPYSLGAWKTSANFRPPI
jgi:hypothetical protein